MDRIPKATEITNVYAVLKGTDAEQSKRIVLVTGHYDSRNSDTLDVNGAAPGANDDASGTAVSLECARVLSKLKFPATIIFLTVAGEEQGLNGSTSPREDGQGAELEHRSRFEQRHRWRRQERRAGPFGGARVFRGRAEWRRRSRISAAYAGWAARATPDRGNWRAISPMSAGPTMPGVKPMLIFRLDRYLRGGDHFSFQCSRASPAVRITEYREDFHHQHQNVRTENGIEYGDVPKFVDFDYVAHVARLNAATLASLAAAPATAGERAPADERSGERFDADLGRIRRAPRI